MSDSQIQVDLVSDFVCPWCWLGYKQFMAAAKGAKPKPELTFRPYMLDPTVPDLPPFPQRGSPMTARIIVTI